MVPLSGFVPTRSILIDPLSLSSNVTMLTAIPREELARYKKEVERRQRLKAGTDGSSGGREGEESSKAEGKAKASASKQEKK